MNTEYISKLMTTFISPDFCQLSLTIVNHCQLFPSPRQRKIAFQAARYTGGTKTGVKRLATINNDACTNKNSTRKECYINHL